MILNLRFHGVLIGGKRVGFDEYFVSLRGWAVKRNHHEVQVHGERIHYNHFDGKSADQAGNRLGEDLVVGHPGIARVKMRIHAEPRPLLQLPLDVFARGFRLQPERVAAKINAVGAVWLFRDVKAFAEVSERVTSGLLCGEVLRRIEFSGRHL